MGTCTCTCRSLIMLVCVLLYTHTVQCIYCMNIHVHAPTAIIPNTIDQKSFAVKMFLVELYHKILTRELHSRQIIIL